MRNLTYFSSGRKLKEFRENYLKYLLYTENCLEIKNVFFLSFLSFSSGPVEWFNFWHQKFSKYHTVEKKTIWSPERWLFCYSQKRPFLRLHGIWNVFTKVEALAQLLRFLFLTILWHDNKRSFFIFPRQISKIGKLLTTKTANLNVGQLRFVKIWRSRLTYSGSKIFIKFMWLTIFIDQEPIRSPI